MATPSLAMIPSAIADAKVFSVLPNNGDGDFTFNRDSSATRIGQNGLIQTVGFFGSEEVTNGDFATDSDWSKGTGWTISGGKASQSGGVGQLSQTIGISTGVDCKIEITVTVTAGTIRISPGPSGIGANFSVSGTYSFNDSFVGNSILYILGTSSSFVGSISNISIKEVTGDQPRLNYDISNGVVQSCPSLLLEPASTNLINYSQAISNTPIKNGTFVDNASISPDGTLNATKLTATTTDPFFYQSITFAAATYTSSIYVKGIGDSIGKEFRIAISSSTTAPKLIVPSEWTRFEFTATVGASTATTGIEITDPAIVGDEVLVWGWQVEQQPYATSYIPTLSGASQTRAAETCFGAGTSSTFNSTEGVLYAEISALADDVTNRRIQLSDGTTANRMYISYKNYTNQIRVEIISSSSSVFDATYSAIDITIFSKIALKYKVNDFALWVNGVERQTDNSGSVPSGLSELAFDDGIGNNDFYGNTKDVRVYNEALTDLQLQKLTTL